MFRIMYKSKIHRAKVTEADLNYEGSVTIDEELLEAAGILPNEMVQILNLNNGERFDTYAIKGERGSGIICLNGPAARLAQVGDIIVIISYGIFSSDELKALKPKLILVDDNNKIIKEA